jgi:N,N'-diacetyllegionaminate synthase
MSIWSADRTFLIAEAGVNHNGDADRAFAMVELAAAAGADAVKFQTFRAEKLVTRQAAMADYQRANTGSEGSQHEMLRALELSPQLHRQLKRRADELGILFFSTAFDDESIELLESMDQPLWKVPSGEITNYPYLLRIAAMQKPTILSTGMATVSEIGDAVDTLIENGLDRERLCILHCNTEYPTPWGDVNLRAMPAIGAIFGCAFGYSDHTPGVTVSIGAAALGAQVIEKHFTLDKALPGPDHKASLSPAELHEWVASIRDIRAALGSTAKMPTTSEAKNRQVARKILVAGNPIARGEAFSDANLAVKRAGRDGLSPMRWREVVGQLAKRDFTTDEAIEL